MIFVQNKFKRNFFYKVKGDFDFLVGKGKSRKSEHILEMANPKSLARVHSRGI